MTADPRNPFRWLIIFLALLGAAMACGAAAMVDAGIPGERPLLNAGALVAGAMLSLLIVRRILSPRAARRALAAAVLLLAATLLAPGIDGVHRWLRVGPLTVNMASLLVPAMIAMLGRAEISRPPVIAMCAAALAILVAQPDASQATAFAAGVVVLLTGSGARHAAILSAFVALGAAAAWFRRDPLLPVMEVELVFGLMWRSWPVFSVVAGLCLAAVSALPALAARGSADARGGLALSATLALSCLAPLVGAFPVPVVGYGMGFALGFPLALALLLSPRREGL